MMKKFDVIPHTNEDYMSVTYRSIKIIDSYRFLSNRLNSLVKTVVDIIQKTLESLKKGILGEDNVLNNVNQIETLISEDRTIEDL